VATHVLSALVVGGGAGATSLSITPQLMDDGSGDPENSGQARTIRSFCFAGNSVRPGERSVPRTACEQARRSCGEVLADV
jgi:hypothetical protein